MDIIQKLLDLSEKLRDQNHMLTADSLLIRQAAQIIETQPKLQSARFIAHYNAVLPAVYAANSDWTRDMYVREAATLARLSMSVVYDETGE
jgi:hypothetical protein